MILFILKIDEEKAKEISNWEYPDEFSNYPINLVKENTSELLKDSYFAAMDENGELIGFYCFGSAAQIPCINHNVYEDTSPIDIGLVLRPDLCGIGVDFEFLRKCTILCENLYLNKNLRLTVAQSNKSAITVYKKFGFKELHSFETQYGKGNTKFITMAYNIS